MAQKYFPIMPAIDWLQLSCTCMGCLLEYPKDTELFFWKERDFGTKQFAKVFEVYVGTMGNNPMEFAVVSACPRMATIPATTLSIKLSNQVLYDSTFGDWRDLLNTFLQVYDIHVNKISRCDFALDFLYLNNRVSGPKLIKNIKSFVWLKTGSVKVSEHYTMPYSITRSSESLNGKFDVQYYLQAKQFQVRTETMSFGTMRSEASVTIYDKTLELAQHSVKIKDEEGERFVCSKEYIRDAHKMACVYDPHAHTWRIEIRVKDTASFIRCLSTNVERPLCLFDLDKERLQSTIQAAINHYFYLVETPADMLSADMFNPEDVRLKNKKRLKRVELFPTIPVSVSMVRSRKNLKASQYTRGVLNRIEEWATRQERAQQLMKSGGDLSIVDRAIEQVKNLAAKKQDEKLKGLAITMKGVKDLVVEHIDKMTDECKSTLIDAISIIEHYRILETKGYSKSIAKKFDSLASAIDIKDVNPLSYARGGAFVPTDAAILRSARDIAQRFYTGAKTPDMVYASTRIYKGCIYNAITAINDAPSYPPLQAFNAVIGYMANKEYLDDEGWHDILKEFRYTPFYQIVHRNFDMELYFKSMHLPVVEGYFRPVFTSWQEQRLKDMVRYAAEIKDMKLDNPIIL